MENKIVKIKMLVLYDLLCRYTDEDHALNSDEIIKLLEEKGIKETRKTLPEDIAMLNAFGYEVNSYKKRYYYYYVVKHQLEIAEIRLFADVVQASKINVGQKRLLMQHLLETTSVHGLTYFKKNMLSLDKPKHSNPEFIYSVDVFEKAIDENKKASFLYYHLDYKKNHIYRNEGAKYNVSPICMVWDKGNYYLLCYDDKHTGIAAYRIDKIEKASIEEQERCEECATFNIEGYRSQVYSMFGGKLSNVEFSFTPDMVDDIFDRYGEDTKIIKQADETLKVKVPVQISKTFFAWVAGSQGKVKILFPKNVIDEFKVFVAKIKEEY